MEAAQGCFSDHYAKWGYSRRVYKWTHFCKHFPHLAKKFDEVPNSIRQFIAVDQNKKRIKGTELACIPDAVQTAVDKHLLARVNIGEEITSAYVQNALTHGIDVWNKCIDSLNDAIQKSNMSQLSSVEKLAGEMDAQRCRQHAEQCKGKMQELLERVDVSTSPGAIENLGLLYERGPRPGPYIYCLLACLLACTSSQAEIRVLRRDV